MRPARRGLSSAPAPGVRREDQLPRRVRVMRPEISLLVELLARSVYERWKAGQHVPGAPAPPPQKQHDPVPEARNFADRPARGSSDGAFGRRLVQNVANGVPGA